MNFINRPNIINASNDVKSLFLNSLEKKKITLNKKIIRNVVLKKLRKKFSLERIQEPDRKNLQKKPGFRSETQHLMGTTINVFANLKMHHKSILDENNLQSISNEALEMKYMDQIRNEVHGEDNFNQMNIEDEKKRKEIENSLVGFKEELELYKQKIREQKRIELMKRDLMFRSELKISQLNQQVKNKLFWDLKKKK